MSVAGGNAAAYGGVFMVSIGSVIAGGFRAFRDAPVALLVWGLSYGALIAGGSIWSLIVMRDHMAGLQPGTMLLLLLPYYVATLLVWLLLTAAAFRSVMRPQARAFAFLRIGGDEARLFVVGIVWFAINFAFYILLVLVVVAVAGTLSTGPDTYFGAMIAAGIITLPVLALMAYIHIRLSPAIPLTILRRQIVIGEAWRLTKGHVLPLFAAYLAIMVILVAAYLVVVIVATAPYWGSRGFAGMAGAMSQANLTEISPLMVASWFMSAAFGAAVYALWSGSVGTATLELLGDETADYATTFA